MGLKMNPKIKTLNQLVEEGYRRISDMPLTFYGWRDGEASMYRSSEEEKDLFLLIGAYKVSRDEGFEEIE